MGYRTLDPRGYCGVFFLADNILFYFLQEIILIATMVPGIYQYKLFCFLIMCSCSKLVETCTRVKYVPGRYIRTHAVRRPLHDDYTLLLVERRGKPYDIKSA